MKNKLFNVVKSLNPSRNAFDLSHEQLLSFNLGYLYPFFFQEVMPSDQLKLTSELLVRMHPLTSPVMGRMNVYTHFFYVPYRMVWDNFENYITGGDDGNFTCPHPVLVMSDGSKINFAKGKLPDYFGIAPMSQTPTLTGQAAISALPFRAYAHIWNEYYRDENLHNKIPFTKSDSVLYSELVELTMVRRRSWARDYFTSAMTDTQKGGEVILPYDIKYQNPAELKDSVGGSPVSKPLVTSPSGQLTADGSALLSMENIEELGITVNDLRKASRLQEYLERNARSGSRMAEWLLSHWSVKADDLRISRPQYLGGSKQAISISEVLSTFESPDQTALGDMGGHGISVGKSSGFKHFFKEFGCVIGILSALPEPYYHQGIPRQFIKFDKFSYPIPEFAQIGEQPIFNGEVYADFSGDNAQLTNTFGYAPRYSEYKHALNRVSGDFHEDLSHWTLSRDFASMPPLNGDFVDANCTAIENKIFPVTDSQATNKFYAYCYHKLTAIRPLPVFGTPKL